MINVTDIAYVRYQAPDLDRMCAFLQDFGLHLSARTEQALYMRGSGRAHHVHVTEQGPAATLGFGFYAASHADLDRLATELGQKVEPNPEPGGGHRLRLRDPSGFQVDILHGRAELPPLPARPSVALNPHDHRERVGATVRLAPAPSNIVRLGHLVLATAHFQETLAFYREVLGFKVSDSYWAGAPENTIAAFLHCGLGEQWTDHHTLAIVATQDGTTRFDHSAFEVLDLDDLVQGQNLLKSRGHTHSWGVGRHVEGSQLFDYWRDPFGHKVEHWTDGDLVNDHTPECSAPLSPEGLAQWAPPLPDDFFA